MALQESRRFHSFFLLAPKAGIPGATLSYNNRNPANIHVYEEKDIDTIGFWRAIMRNEINVNDGESVESSVPRISEGSAAAANAQLSMIVLVVRLPEPNQFSSIVLMDRDINLFPLCNRNQQRYKLHSGWYTA